MTGDICCRLQTFGYARLIVTVRFTMPTYSLYIGQRHLAHYHGHGFVSRSQFTYRKLIIKTKYFHGLSSTLFIFHDHKISLTEICKDSLIPWPKVLFFKNFKAL